MKSFVRRLRTRLERWWWPRSRGPRRAARAARRELSVLRSRLRRDAPRVLWTRAVAPPTGSSSAPAIAALDVAPFARQTEAELLTAVDPRASEAEASTADWLVALDDRPDARTSEGDEALPAETVEALLLVATACDVDVAVAGATPPTDGLHPTGPVRAFEGAGAVTLTRIGIDGDRSSPLAGRLVCCVDDAPRGAARTVPLTATAGLDLLRLDATGVLRREIVEVDAALAALPPRPDPGGRPTLLFLLPYLAVGGAERLLFDLLDGLRDRYRLLVATTDPHRRILGQTIDRCRRRADAVYTLGDWLPREALAGALRHLLRRHAVDALISWNGTVLFYDQVASLRRRFPALRILAQLYHHDGAWTARTGGATARAIDTHLAVNRRIASALVDERGVERSRVALVHHGVSLVPPPREDPERDRERRERRRALGLPEDALVFGAFLRLHAQKRPLDLVALARRLAGDGWWLLLVGGGPLDDAIDRELAARPAPNVVRRPLTREPLPLYDAVDVCVSTSSYEGLPVFLLDALARAIPCVATAVGDVPLLLEGGGGVLVETPGDLDAFAAALRSLADHETRRREGLRGRATVGERFSLERSRDAYARLLPTAPGERP